MKNFKLGAIALLTTLGLGTAASAIDLGYGVNLDNTVAGEYNVETEVFTIDYTANINYTVVDGVVVWVETTVDIQDVAYAGVDFGANWSVDSAISVYVKSS